ncbi:phenylalanine--tRNA ligase subunit alpha [Pyrofollis japonicus]|uniref:phenylalanine--tRNA ligase subunit alpha n=1 Tax=Pyrofollis japonicus TaxID=3060460 RepID=UPI00295BE86B|nr:phenylalanine--tRNA ligase subunit alpha [Pyrofollis japonicus]BEP17041.1 phenylalanine--tRNA ligase subunit alpha [Pyrofollis japonicus]
MGAISVSESEYELLKIMASKKISPNKEYNTDVLAKILNIEKSRLEALLRLLASKGLVVLKEKIVEEYHLTSEAKRYISEGFPEEVLVKLLTEMGGEASVDAIRERLGDIAPIAIANASKKKWIRIEGGRVKLVVDPANAVADERKIIEKIMRGEKLDPSSIKLLKRRKLVEVHKKRVTIVELPEDPESLMKKVIVEIGALTRELIESGKWRSVRLREYNVEALPPRVLPGRLNFFSQFIEYIRDVMKELGFVEVEAPPVELEFWNYDVLFQPQFHPARSPTDTFYLKAPSAAELPKELVKKVAQAHEQGMGGSKGWRYKWDPRQAMRLILRSHTTAVSARILSTKPSLPFRYFSLGRVYRVENIDPRHLPEFHQVDGIASEDGVSLRWLVGMLSEFLERLGLTDYKFRPAYFPFTEPSIEGYVRIGSGWLEVLGAGLFRPEMLNALGIEYPVAAWGMGIERLAMALYGLRDIRQLYSNDIEFISSIPSRWWLYAGSKV